MLERYKKWVIAGGKLTKEEAKELLSYPLDLLCQSAHAIQQHFCSNQFDLCTIMNVKSGKCSEDCSYCAQSSYYATNISCYDLLDASQIIAQGIQNGKNGARHFGLVASGRALLEEEINSICKIISQLKEEGAVSVCGSFGLLSKEQFDQLKRAGLSRVHKNIETAEGHFKNICTTHSYEQNVKTVQRAMEAGFFVCCGGIIGLGESWEDRIDMAFALEEMGVLSIPLNLLNKISGTPCAKLPSLSEEEFLKTIALFRFINPKAWIRLAGGRGLLPEGGRNCFLAGANAAITGDMLTTQGISIEKDKIMLEELGYEVRE